MILNFMPWFWNEYTLKVVDTTIPNPKETPDIIYSMTISITSDKIPNGGTYNFDVNSYILLYKKDRTLYEFTPEILGMSSGSTFEDGVYTIQVNINNNYIKEKKVVKFSNIKNQVEQLLKDTCTEFDVQKYTVTYKSETTKTNQELILNCIVLLNNIYSLAQEPNDIEINNTITKLNQILTIIQNDYGKSNLH